MFKLYYISDNLWRYFKLNLFLLVFSMARMSKRPLSKCYGNETAPGLDLSTLVRSGGRTKERKIVTSKPGLAFNSLDDYFNSLPLIAIMAASTTRRVEKPSTVNLALFMYLLPSLVRSLDCGFRYEYVLGYDKKDALYDNEEVKLLYFL